MSYSNAENHVYIYPGLESDFKTTHLCKTIFIYFPNIEIKKNSVGSDTTLFVVFFSVKVECVSWKQLTPVKYPKTKQKSLCFVAT